ncbi:MAG: leucine-rich repeat protein [Clostridia bacterium]|nr:leucine-rich repeat protein [Clostridia bacterium]
MTVFKCKICGGALEIDSAQSVATCEYCGTKQTLPRLDDERRANLYDRANHFRRNNDFDKAMGIFEQILNEEPTDAEAYWSIVLCRYGIEYVEDPATRRRVPTINRVQFTSIFDDEDYKSAIANADGYQRDIYEAEATAINELQKGILAISQAEEPFDVFICYKETDANGRRTQDSVLATELYHELTKEGFKVFFSRITLEDKLGVAYEPYIFAALHSAKVMVVLGTRPEHFNAVWVKNEWSRYLALIKNGAKKTLIPAYRDMDPYDLPEEFSHLQAQDMSKLGFMQDLTRGIKKIVEADAPKGTSKETVATTALNITPLLKRVFMFLEDGDFESANEYCEKVLDQDPENAQVYLGKLMAKLQVRRPADLCQLNYPLNDDPDYKKVLRFADDELKQKILNCNSEIVYNKAAMYASECQDSAALIAAAELFESIANYKDAAKRAASCRQEAARARKKSEEAWQAAQRAARQRARRSRIIALSLIIPVVCAVIAFIIYYNTVTSPKIDGLVFKKVDDTYHLTAYNGQNSAVAIPSEIEGKPVTTIKASAFQNCTELQSVTIPSSITTIEKGSFNGCINLKSMTLPFVGIQAEDRSVGATFTYPFGYYFGTSNYKGAIEVTQTAYSDRGKSSINYYIPVSLSSITILGGDIPSGAFANCENLTSVTIGRDVTKIGEGAFYNCIGLKEVRITDITAWCKITFEDSEANPLQYAKNLYLKGTLVRVLVIPSSVTSIKNFAFFGCSKLTRITIPSSVTSIGACAFYGCTELTNVTIPSSVTSIGEQAFSECTELTSITIPASVKSIGIFCFAGCDSLTAVTFQDFNDWAVSQTDTFSSRKDLSPGSLSIPSTAKTYLTSTYCTYYWKKG